METTPRKTVLRVDGMTCGSCVRHVRSALGELDGVRAVDVQLREGKVTVEQKGQGASVTSMIEALREAGYEATPEPMAPGAALS